ncbi:MAG: hypothetical protein ACR2MS_08475 [Weeksellaceae bacterium]
MKILLLTLAFSTALTVGLYGQNDTTVTISDKIKMERDSELNSYKNKLKENDIEIKKLQDKLSESNNNQVKIATLEGLQQKLDERIKALESASKRKANYNGQLALIELLSVQRDLQPAQLFSSSQTFFSQLGNISNLQNYPSFTTWKTEYDKWYVKQDRDDQMIELVNSSIGLIGDVANKVPLYGSIVQTVSSGIGTLISSFGNKHKELKKKTPEMLRLLNATSQFENQKAIIDHEWEQINKELSQLQAENDKLLREQLKYYGIDYNQYESEYLNATLETERDRFKTKCRTTLNTKITAFDKDTVTANKWLGQVETYMYKVQSLRIRFGNLTNRMLSNIDRYEQLIKIYSDKTKFPQELTDKIEGLGKTLSSVKKNFSTTFKPEKYIEDSAVMYIEKSE